MSYAAIAARARKIVAKKGAPVVFSITAGETYNPLTGAETGGAASTVTGFAVRTKGDPLKYQALELIPSEAPTLLFTPDVPGQLPALGSAVPFGGRQYVVRDVEPIAPAGQALAARIVITGGGPG